MKNDGSDITFLLCLKTIGWDKKKLGKFLLQYIFSKCNFNFFCCEICNKKVYWTNLYICATETICNACLEPKLSEKYFSYYDVSASNYVEIFYGRIIITFLKETFKICSILFYKASFPSFSRSEKEGPVFLKPFISNKQYIKKNRLTLSDKFLLHHFDQYKKIMCGCKAVQEYIHTIFLNS
jgi:hypothetical protein